MAKGATDELKREFRDIFDAARGGAASLADFFTSRIREKLLESFAEAAARAALGIGESGGSGWLDKAFSAGAKLLGFGRAAGGNVVGGQMYPVNERGHLEAFVAPQSGKIVPLGNMKAAGRAGASASVTMNMKIVLDGANGDATIRRIAHEAAATGAAQAVAVATGIAQRNAPARLRRYQELGT